jgi:hypothetical protein
MAPHFNNLNAIETSLSERIGIGGEHFDENLSIDGNFDFQRQSKPTID